MKNLVILPVLFVAVSCSSLLGREKCTWGPAYWCSDVSNAVKCGSVEHCVTRAWKEQIPTVKSSNAGECSECQNFVSGISRTEKTSRAAGLGLMKHICSHALLTHHELCTSMAEGNVEAFFSLVQNDYDALSICQIFKHCSSSVRRPHQVVEVKADPTACSLCEFAIREAESLLKQNNTEATIEAALDQLCAMLPNSTAAECDQLVKTYTPVIINVLELLGTPQEVCTAVHLCNSTSPTKDHVNIRKLPAAPKAGPAECSLCELAMKELDNLLGDNRTEAAVESALEELCSALPNATAAQCEQLVKMYTPIILTLLEQVGDPQQICKLVQLCSSSTSVTYGRAIERKEVTLRANPTPQCALCEFVMQELDDVLAANNTAVTVESALDQLCGLLPNATAAECDKLVQMYTPLVLKTLGEMGSPGEVCTIAKICNSTTPIPSNGTIECEVCEVVVSEMKTMLKQQEGTEKQLLLAMCGDLTGVLKNECSAVVNAYGDTVIGMLIAAIDPPTVCKKLTLCPGTKTFQPFRPDGLLHILRAAGRN